MANTPQVVNYITYLNTRIGTSVCQFWKVNSFIPADQTGTFTNSVDPDEMAHNKPSNQHLNCLSFCFFFCCCCFFFLILILDRNIFLRQWWKSPLQKLRDESVHMSRLGGNYYQWNGSSIPYGRIVCFVSERTLSLILLPFVSYMLGQTNTNISKQCRPRSNWSSSLINICTDCLCIRFRYLIRLSDEPD